MKSHQLIATALLMALLLLNNGLTSSDGIAQDDEGARLPIREIVYVCDDGDAEICVISTDGRRFKQLTNNSTQDLAPSINDSGQIAFQCGFDPNDTEGKYEICSINSDGSEQMLITEGEFSSFTPDINESGLIAFNCPTETRPRSAPVRENQSQVEVFYGICTVQHDGSDLRIATAGQASDLVPEGRVLGSAPDINNNGDIVFVCWFRIEERLGLYPHLCNIGADGESLQIITNYPLWAEGPSLNDAGQIAFSCIPPGEIPVYDKDICLINSDGTGYIVLFRDVTFDEAHPRISEDGWVAYECTGNLLIGSAICIVADDGSGRRQVAASSVEKEITTPVMLQEGILIYVCSDGDKEICMLYDDANTALKITRNGSDDINPDL
jgi:hypothetical protein